MSPLTFGVEFEFLVATLPSSVSDPDPADLRPVKRLDIPDPSIQLAPWERHGAADYSFRGLVVGALQSAGLPSFIYGDSPPLYPRWEVADDNSISIPAKLVAKRYKCYTVETKSPPYYFCPEGLEAISLACKTLTANFRINVNRSCGLHVHVGDGERGFDLLTLKNLAAFFWVFEPVLDKIHPPHRKNGAYCRSMRAISRLVQQYGVRSGAQAPQSSGRKFFQSEHSRAGGEAQAPVPNLKALRLIYATKSINTLVGLVMNPLSPWMAVNFYPQRRPFNDFVRTKRTVEFRMHDGTMDPERVLTWVKTVVGIVELARESEPADFLWLLLEGVRREDEVGDKMGLGELLNEIGLDEEAKFYQARGVDD